MEVFPPDKPGRHSMKITLICEGKLTYIQLVKYPVEDCEYIFIAFCANLLQWYCLLKKNMGLAWTTWGRPAVRPAMIDIALDSVVPIHDATGRSTKL